MGGDVMEEIYETRFIPPLKKRIADLEAALVSETTRANDAVERASRNAIACNRQEERAEAAEAELKHARERAEVPCAGIGSDEVGCPKTLHLARYRTVRANEDDTLAYRCSDCGQTFCLSCLRLHFAARKEQATDAVEAELTGYIELDEALKEQAPAERCPGCVADAEPGVWRRIVPHNLDCESKAPAGGKGVSERTVPGRDADPPPNPAGPRILGQLARDNLLANQPPAPQRERCPICGNRFTDHQEWNGYTGVCPASEPKTEERCPKCRHSHAGTERCGVIGRIGRVCACPATPKPKKKED